jgi:hypothetical protein
MVRRRPRCRRARPAAIRHAQQRRCLGRGRCLGFAAEDELAHESLSALLSRRRRKGGTPPRRLPGRRHVAELAHARMNSDRMPPYPGSRLSALAPLNRAPDLAQSASERAAMTLAVRPSQVRVQMQAATRHRSTTAIDTRSTGTSSSARSATRSTPSSRRRAHTALRAETIITPNY